MIIWYDLCQKIHTNISANRHLEYLGISWDSAVFSTSCFLWCSWPACDWDLKPAKELPMGKQHGYPRNLKDINVTTALLQGRIVMECPSKNSRNPAVAWPPRMKFVPLPRCGQDTLRCVLLLEIGWFLRQQQLVLLLSQKVHTLKSEKLETTAGWDVQDWSHTFCLMLSFVRPFSCRV